jgi:CRISPR-associated protein Csh1
MERGRIMLKDLVPKFFEELNEHPGLILDNYDLKEGAYFRLFLDRTLEENLANLEYVIIRKKEEVGAAKKDIVKWFKIRDYYSSLLYDSTNKAVDNQKKFHNTNGLTLFVKSNIIMDKEAKFPVSEIYPHLEKFYTDYLPKAGEKLFDLYPLQSKSKNKKSVELAERQDFFKKEYGKLVEYLHSETRKQLYQKVQDFWRQYFDQFLLIIQEIIRENKIDNYIKIFFDADEDIYRKEYQIYVLPRIFNVNDYNQLNHGKILGLPAYDVNMNAKKPFLELKSMKAKVPTRVTVEEALVIKDLSKWLEQQGKFKEYILPGSNPFAIDRERWLRRDPGSIHMRLDKNGSIEYFEQVPFKSREKLLIEIENFLQIEEKDNAQKYVKYYDPIQSTGQLYHQINELFFNNYLKYGFFNSDIPKVKENEFPGEMQTIYVMARQALYDFIFKGTNQTIKPFIKKFSRQLIEIQICKTSKGLNFKKTAEAFLLRTALMKFIGYEEGSILAATTKALYEKLSIKLKDKETFVECESDPEFYFLAGQLGYYLLFQSEAKDKNFGMAEPIMQIKYANQLKRHLRDLFETYSHAIRFNYVTVKNAMSMVFGYLTSRERIDETNKDYLFAGLIGKNLLLQSNKKEGDKQDGEAK